MVMKDKTNAVDRKFGEQFRGGAQKKKFRRCYITDPGRAPSVMNLLIRVMDYTLLIDLLVRTMSRTLWVPIAVSLTQTHLYLLT